MAEDALHKSELEILPRTKMKPEHQELKLDECTPRQPSTTHRDELPGILRGEATDLIALFG